MYMYLAVIELLKVVEGGGGGGARDKMDYGNILWHSW